MPLTSGRTNDSPLLPAVLDELVVPRLEGGPPRRNPDVTIADRAYSTASNRTPLRRRRIHTPIPEPSDRSPTANAKATTTAGHHASTPSSTSVATSSNALSTRPSTGARSPPSTTSSRPPTVPDSSWPSSSNGSNHGETRPSRASPLRRCLVAQIPAIRKRTGWKTQAGHLRRKGLAP
ncbi:transposase [Nocardia sp. NBC_00403]|uniref:transposase n=1 Tax=Nocardia sp. NBC_00403 TaxID=2975990 RepID=UPI003FA580A6